VTTASVCWTRIGIGQVAAPTNNNKYNNNMTLIKDSFLPLYPGPGSDSVEYKNRLAARKAGRGPDVNAAQTNALLGWCLSQGLQYVEDISEEIFLRYLRRDASAPLWPCSYQRHRDWVEVKGPEWDTLWVPPEALDPREWS
jgi:hypothetical protein